MADIIQANYDQLSEIAKRFGTQSETTTQTLQRIARAIDKLQNGDWIGRGSDAFFVEMETEVIPAARRLIDALSQAGQVTNDISALIQTADEEASAPFRNSNGSNRTRGNSTVDRFAQMASAVYPADPQAGNGGSSWQNGGFAGSAMGTNAFTSLLNEQGFAADSGSNLTGGDGLGSGSTGFTGGENNFGIPQDWLADVTAGGNSSLNGLMSSGYNEYGIPRDWLSGVNDALGQDQGIGMNVQRDWLSGVMSGLDQDLSGASAAGGGDSGSGGSSGGSDSGGSSGGGSGSGTPSETPPSESASPATGGGGGSGTPQSQVTDPYGRGGFGQGYTQTTVSAAAAEQSAPRLRYQPMSGGGGGGNMVEQDPRLARVDPTAGWSAGGGQFPAMGGNDDRGLRGLSIGIAAVSPLIALAGKMLKDKLGDEQ